MRNVVVHLHPEVERLIAVSNSPHSLTVFQAEACAAAKSAGIRWQQVHQQLKILKASSALSSTQRLQLATCERHFLAYFSGYSDHQSMFSNVLPLISHQHLSASLNMLSSSAKCCASAGQFEQAVGMLNHAFSWAEQHAHTRSFWPVFAAAVFVCNRLMMPSSALKYAHHCYFLAEQDGNEAELQMSKFQIMNSSRLAKTNNPYHHYHVELKALEQGKLKYDALNQFLLPVYAALEALKREQPNCKIAANALAIALERSDDANDYGIAQYLLALSHYHLAFAKIRQARDAIAEAAHLMPEADQTLVNGVQHMCAQLGLKLQTCETRKKVAVTAQTWRLFQTLSQQAIQQATTYPAEA